MAAVIVTEKVNLSPIQYAHHAAKIYLPKKMVRQEMDLRSIVDQLHKICESKYLMRNQEIVKNRRTLNKLFPCFAICGIFALILISCVTQTSHVKNEPGRQSAYLDEQTPDGIGDVGFGSQDIVGAVDKMMRDILINPFWSREANAEPPRIIVDSRCFTNEGASDININMLTDRLRVELSRSARGRMVFLARHLADMVEKERMLKKEGTVDKGTSATVASPFGADYRLCGNITTLDKIAGDKMSRFTQIAFEIVDLDSDALAWSGISSFKKTGDIPVQVAREQGISGSKQEITAPLSTKGVRVWADQQVYRVGEKLSVHFQSDWNCYVFFYLESADGQTSLLFPNQYDENNYIQAGRTYTIPNPGYGFDLTIAPPLGVERIKVLATTDPARVKDWRMKASRGLMMEARERQASVVYRVVP